MLGKSAARPRGQKLRFYDGPDRMIFGSTRTLVTLLRPWIRRLTLIISLLGSFEQAANSVGKNLKKSTGALDD